VLRACSSAGSPGRHSRSRRGASTAACGACSRRHTKANPGRTEIVAGRAPRADG